MTFDIHIYIYIWYYATKIFLTNHILPEPFRILCAVRLRTCKPCLGRLGQVLVTNFLPQTDLAPVLHRQAEAGGNVDKAGQIFVGFKSPKSWACGTPLQHPKTNSSPPLKICRAPKKEIHSLTTMDFLRALLVSGKIIKGIMQKSTKNYSVHVFFLQWLYRCIETK